MNNYNKHNIDFNPQSMKKKYFFMACFKKVYLHLYTYTQV